MTTTTTAFIVLCGALLANGAFIRRPDLDGRIVGGADGKIVDHPYQLSVKIGENNLCGATIIGENWAITAATCVQSVSAVDLEVRAGSNRVDNGGELHQVKRIIVHGKYDSNTVDYDFALLRIEPAFVFGKRVQAIEMVDAEPKGDQTAVISGWGLTSPSDVSYAKHIQTASVPIVNRKKCIRKYNELHEITERMICAGLGEDGAGPCQGDGGGPLVVDGKLAGITSWGAGCGNADYPAVYSNVADQREWIKKRTGI